MKKKADFKRRIVVVELDEGDIKILQDALDYTARVPVFLAMFIEKINKTIDTEVEE